MTKVRKKLSRRSSKLSGWVWMIIGGFSGLLIASIIPKNTKNIILTDIPTEKKEATKLIQTIKPDQIITNRFSFYEVLPKVEVVIPDKQNDLIEGAQTNRMFESGSYILQVGSFIKNLDAEKQQILLNKMGIQSEIKKISIADKIFYRVRIGPISDAVKLNNIYDELKKANVEVLKIKSGDS